MLVHPVIPVRSSPALWCAPIILAAMIYAWASILAPFPPNAYLNAYVVRAAHGFIYGLPLTAGVAAWVANRFARGRRQVFAVAERNPIRIFWTHTWMLFATVALGYLITVIWQIALAPPAPGSPDLWVLLTFTGMVVIAVGFGYMLGVLLPIPLAMPIAIFGLFEWISYPAIDAVNLSWRNITGYSLSGCCDVFSRAPDYRAIIAPILIAIPVLLLAVLSVRFQWYRYLPPALALVALGIVAANLVVVGSNPLASRDRPASDLVCAGSHPAICLFPEQSGAEDGKQLREVLTSAYNTAGSNGLSLPSRLMASSATEYSQTALTETPLQAGVGGTPNTIIAAYAASTYQSLQCSEPPIVKSKLDRATVVTYAIARVMGGSKFGVLPSVSTSVDLGPDSAVQREQILQLLGVESFEQARAISAQWFSAQTDCLDKK